MKRKKIVFPDLKFFLFVKLCFAFIFFSSYMLSGQNVELQISGLRSTKGVILLGIFKDHESFKKEIPFKSFKFDKKSVLNGSIKFTFDLEEGIYGITLLDDENENGKMDYNYIGIPKEGFGFSEYYHKGITKPHFNDFKQKVIKNQNNKFNIQVKYM